MLEILSKYYAKISAIAILIVIGMIIIGSSIVLNYFNRQVPFSPQNRSEYFKAVSVELISLQTVKEAQIQANQPTVETFPQTTDTVALVAEENCQLCQPPEDPLVDDEPEILPIVEPEVAQGIANAPVPVDEIDNQWVVGEGNQNDPENPMVQLIAAQIQEKIWDKWYLPNGISHIVAAEVVLRLSEIGEVISIEFTRSSGSPAVDLSIEHAIHNASPFTIINKLPSDHLRESFKWLVIEFSPDSFLNS